jgi:hypothetical protein
MTEPNMKTIIVNKDGYSFDNFVIDMEAVGWKYDAHLKVFTHENAKPFKPHEVDVNWVIFAKRGLTVAPF